MATTAPKIVLVLVFLIALSSPLQVTPNSPCSTLCLDDSRFSPADATLSTIKGTDVACNDAQYSEAKDQKFQKCLECLQTSDFGTDEENDQGWFIYNLSFATNWCLFAPENTDKPTGPCMVVSTCGGLEIPLKIENEEPRNQSHYDYCSSGNGIFESEANVCNACLQHMPDNKVLSNWILALQGGCAQRPSQKTLIGFDGSIFGLSAINITTSISPSAAAAAAAAAKTANSKDNKLSTGAVTGIAVSVAVTILVILGVIAIQCYKRRRARVMKRLYTKCHPRFGSTDITAPSGGSCSEYTQEPVVEALPWDADKFIMKDMRSESSLSGHSKASTNSTSVMRVVLTPEPSNLTPVPIRPPMQKCFDGQDSPVFNPLRMNSVVKPNTASAESLRAATPAELTTARAKVTAFPIEATEARFAPNPQPLTTNNLTSYETANQLQHAPRPNYASSVVSTASTAFSPGVYGSPPPPYLGNSPHSRPNSIARANFPVAPLPAYNPASYAPKPNNQYHSQFNTWQQQPQFNTRPQHAQAQSKSPKPRPALLNIYKPLPSQASARYTPFPSQPQAHAQPKSQSQPPRSHRSTASRSSVATNRSVVPKQTSNTVPIIALPVPTPKRKTVDMRSFIGMNINTHVKLDDNPLPSSLPVNAVSASKGDKEVIDQKQRELGSELPRGFDRTSSLIRKSGSPFREIAEGLGCKRMTAMPADLRRDSDIPTSVNSEDRYSVSRSSSVTRPVSKASLRGRSSSRPRKEGMKSSASRERGGSRGVNRQGREGSESRNRQSLTTESKLGFIFDFRGQDTVVESSPQSGSTSTSSEKWPGTGVIKHSY